MASAAQIRKLSADGLTPPKIAERLGVSRQYVHQVLHQPEKDGGRVAHGTVARAATCECPACAQAKAKFLAGLPDVLSRMRAGEPLAPIGKAHGYNIVDMVAKGQRAVEAGRPTLLGELVKVYAETTGLRKSGGPGRPKAAPAKPSKRAA